MLIWWLFKPANKDNIRGNTVLYKADARLQCISSFLIKTDTVKVITLSWSVLARGGTNSTHQAGEAGFQPNQQRCFLPGWLTTHHRGNPEYIRYPGEQPTEARRFNLHSVSSPVFSASTALIDRVICGKDKTATWHPCHLHSERGRGWWFAGNDMTFPTFSPTLCLCQKVFWRLHGVSGQ